MSPFALGFQEWPQEPLKRQFAFGVYRVSFFIGLPVLLIGQIASVVQAMRGKYKFAYAIPIFTISVFTACVAVVLTLIESGA